MTEEECLVLEIDIQFKHIVSSQLSYVSFISFDLILDAHYILIPASIESPPESLDFQDPCLMRNVGNIICILLLSVDWKEMLQSLHLTIRVEFLVHDELDFNWRFTTAFNVAFNILHATLF